MSATNNSDMLSYLLKPFLKVLDKIKSDKYKTVIVIIIFALSVIYLSFKFELTFWHVVLIFGAFLFIIFCLLILVKPNKKEIKGNNKNKKEKPRKVHLTIVGDNDGGYISKTEGRPLIKKTE